MIDEQPKQPKQPTQPTQPTQCLVLGVDILDDRRPIDPNPFPPNIEND